MMTIVISIYLSIIFSYEWYFFIKEKESKEEQTYEGFFKSVLEDPNFIRAKENIMHFSKTMAREERNEDLLLYKKVNDMQFIDLNKQAQNEGIQNQNFAEIVYIIEEYISMLHNYPNQIHSVSEIQRKAIFEKFIILKKQ